MRWSSGVTDKVGKMIREQTDVMSEDEYLQYIVKKMGEIKD